MTKKRSQTSDISEENRRIYFQYLLHLCCYPFVLLYYIVCSFFHSLVFFFTFRKDKELSIEELQKEVEF